MTPPPRPLPTGRFDRVAAAYRPIESVAFGRLLQHARTAHLHHLSTARDILVVGEGDGRCLAALRRINAAAAIDVIDTSPAMLARAAARCPAANFRHADIRTTPLDAGRYDAIVTHFVLDCFTQPDADAVITRLAAAAAPRVTWLLADFALPPRSAGLLRLHAHLWLAAMYGFFRVATGLRASRLPDVSTPLRAAGLNRSHCRTWRSGLIESAIWHRG